MASRTEGKLKRKSRWNTNGTKAKRAKKSTDNVRAMDFTHLKNQTESPLLRLPAEIRNVIYDYAFGECRVHTYWQFEPKNTSETIDSYCPIVDTSSGRHVSYLLNISLSSKQMHSETICLLYTRNVFRVSDPHFALHWISRLGPGKKELINTLEVEYLDIKMLLTFPTPCINPSDLFELAKRNWFHVMEQLSGLKRVIVVTPPHCKCWDPSKLKRILPRGIWRRTGRESLDVVMVRRSAF